MPLSLPLLKALLILPPLKLSLLPSEALAKGAPLLSDGCTWEIKKRIPSESKRSGGVEMDRKAYPLSASDYTIQEEIGHGVSATVYKALCIPFGEIVAIKSIDLERFSGNLDVVRREAQTMSLINHPNVLKAHCSFVVDRALWVIMAYMAGGSCLHIMKVAYPEGFEEAIIATFLKETLKALEYLHHHGHIHRDVKAGNILIDANGSVKLGDFGVSAFMFDAGDRQRSRNTFIGTPCWMAPEVMEQVHGYDFKADIWSFGITALELAHGHAPFSKYPPIKVLLLTLQNAPPGLDYERDKRFSKSFKEMIAMCLVKDPTKRPSAEKLLKHAFFKQAKSADYIARTILDPLPTLWERVTDLKNKDAARLVQKKMPYGEQEERSQNEYKRGVSSWNFDVEDLKAQAALIQDDELPLVKEESEPKDSEDSSKSSSLQPTIVHENENQTLAPVTIHSLKAESGADSGERFMRVRSGPLPSPPLPKSVTNSKEVSRAVDDHTQHSQFSKQQRPSSAPLLSSTPPIGIIASGPARASTGQKDVPEEKLKGSIVQKKGRFSVTSDENESTESSQASSNGRKTPSVQTTPVPLISVPSLASTAPLNSSGYNVSTVLPQFRTLLSHTMMQQDMIINLMTSLNMNENFNASRSTSHISKTMARSASSSSTDSMVEIPTDRERELLNQVAELQCRMATLSEELQSLKLKNVQLERKLNAIYNKEEEERIRREEAAREDA